MRSGPLRLIGPLCLGLLLYFQASPLGAAPKPSPSPSPLFDTVTVDLQTIPPGADMWIDLREGDRAGPFLYLGKAGQVHEFNRPYKKQKEGRRWEPDQSFDVHLLYMDPFPLTRPETVNNPEQLYRTRGGQATALFGIFDHYERLRLPVLPGGPPHVITIPKDKPLEGKLRPRYRLVGWGWERWKLFTAMALLAGLATAAVLLTRRLRRKAEHADAFTEETVGTTEEDLNLGKILGGYRLIEHLGQGGMARVYRGVKVNSRESDTSQHVAIKIMHTELAKDDRSISRFLRETGIYKELNHPSIVKVFDAGHDDNGHPYIIMELIQGKPLSDLIPEGGMPVREALQLLRPVFHALAYAHKSDIVHRDVKPENVMCLNDGTVRVMDFGLAKGAMSTKVTATGAFLGTPAYMAPEQVTKPGEIFPASDQYALGMLVFEVLAGQLPWSETDVFQFITKHIMETPPSIREFKPQLSPAIEQVIARMLEKRPEDRYPSIEAALQALEAAAH